MRPEFFIPFIVALAPVAIVLIVLRYRNLQTQARYAAMMHIVDKGMELPAQLLIEPRVEFCERRRALVLISIGLGIIAMFLALPVHHESGHRVGVLWGLGLLPLFAGFGYLASWWLNRRDGGNG